MRVLVAGATSSLGRILLTELVDAGHEPVTSTIDPTHRSSYLASLAGITADAVINIFGASTRLAPGTRAQVALNRARAEGMSTMLAAAERVGATRFVAGSTFAGYGLSDHGDVPVVETAAFSLGDDAEATSLRSAEQQAVSRGALVLRFGQLWSEGATSVPPVARQWAGQLPVVHVRDAARAAVLALERGVPGSVYNIAAEETATWRQLQEAQSRVDGFPPPRVLDVSMLRLIAPVAARVIGDTSLRLSVVSAGYELGWSAHFDAETVAAGDADAAPYAGSNPETMAASSASEPAAA